MHAVSTNQIADSLHFNDNSDMRIIIEIKTKDKKKNKKEQKKNKNKVKQAM